MAASIASSPASASGSETKSDEREPAGVA
jgi:hypothetical protein